MSDSDGDFSDELLELAGASEKKRKKTTSSKAQAKRRKAEIPKSDSEEDEYESEEDNSNPYPLDGKYIDETDRERLLLLPEIERENILAQRLDEMQHFQDKRNLDQMLREQKGESENVAKAAKRAHQGRGATKEKAQKLDELKAKRKAKSEKKRTKASSPKRDRSSSPMDMEMSSEDEEDGQISKQDLEEEREARILNSSKSEEEVITLQDMNNCRLSRDNLSKYAKMPWFEEYVKGSYVRYLIGKDKKDTVYRICEVMNIGTPATKAYKVDDEYHDTMLDLRYGVAQKAFPIDRVSNGEFTDVEFKRYKMVSEAEKFKMPSKRAIEKKMQQYAKFPEQALTEADVQAIIDKNNRTSVRAARSSTAMERAELVQMRILAQRRRDFADCAQIEARLAELDEKLALKAPSVAEVKEDILGKVNERNRQANREAVRKAEAAEAERKRKAWIARAAANSRPGTPGNLKTDSPGGTPKTGTTLKLPDVDGKRSTSPLPGKGPLGKRTFESIVANSVEIDLGDF